MGVWSMIVGGLKQTAGIVKDIVADTFKGLQAVTHEAGKKWDEYENSLAHLARTAGMSAEQFHRLQTEINDINLATDAAGKTIAARFGYASSEMAKWTAELSSNIGRNVTWTTEQYESYAALMRFSEDAGAGILAAFQNLGVDAVQTQERLSKVLNSTMKTGVNFSKVLKNATENASALNSLTFRNGINGFTEMAKQAASMNFSMQQTLQLAENIQKGDFNNLAEMSSRLQVLGGPFAQMANPLEILYEGTSDVGALQDRIIKMFSGLGQYNDKTGQVELGRFEKMQVQQAAEALGMSKDEVFKMINTAAIKDRVDSQISSRFTDEDDRELIKNSASINKNGEAVVRIGVGKDSEKKVSELSDKDIEKLRGLQDANTGTSIIQIAQDVRSIADMEKAASTQTDTFANQMYQEDMVAGLGEFAQLLGAAGGAVAGFMGGGIGESIQGLITKLNEGLTGHNLDLSGLSTMADRAAAQINANLNGLQGEQREQAASLAKTLSDSAKSFADGKTSLKDFREFKVNVHMNPVVSKLDIIIGYIKTFAQGVSGTYKFEDGTKTSSTGKTDGAATGGLRVVPHAMGGAVLEGIREGGYLKDIYPAGTPLREETPFARFTRTPHDVGGEIITETAQPAEYILRESAVNKYSPAVLDEVNAGNATIIPHESGGMTKAFDDGGVTEIKAPISMESHSYENNLTKHEGEITLRFGQVPGSIDTTMIKEIRDGINALLNKGDNLYKKK